MSSSSSFRARLESLPLRYSAPAGGYAPMPSPDDAPGIGDRDLETGPTVKVGPDGYGLVASIGGASALSGASGTSAASAGSARSEPGAYSASTPAIPVRSHDAVTARTPGRAASGSDRSQSESASAPEVPAAPIYGVVQTPAPAGYGVVQPRPLPQGPATSPEGTEVLDSPIFGAVSSASPQLSPPQAATADTADTAGATGATGATDPTDTGDTTTGAQPASSTPDDDPAAPTTSKDPASPAGVIESASLGAAGFPEHEDLPDDPAPSSVPAELPAETTHAILSSSPSSAAPLQDTEATREAHDPVVEPDGSDAPDDSTGSADTEDAGGAESVESTAATAPMAPSIVWNSVASAASDAAAHPLSQQDADDEAEEEAPAGPAEVLPVPEEPEPEPDEQVLPDGVPQDGVYVDVDVAIVMESTYPYLKGGVSAVVHDIITGNPDLTFGIIHITWDSHSPLKDLYGMPDNVAWVRVLYLSMEEHQEDFLRARPRDLRMNRRQRRELSRRILGAMLALAQDGSTEPMWEIIGEGLSASRRYPVWAILGTREFMEAYHDMMPDLGMSMTDIFWCLRDFFSLAYAVLAEPVPRASVYHAHTTGYAMLLSVNAAREHGTRVLLTEHNLYVRDTVNTLLERRLDLNVTLTDYLTFDVTGRERMWMAWWLEMGRLCYPYVYASTYLYPRAITEAHELGGDSGRAIVIPNGIVTEEFDASYAARLSAIEEIKKEGADKHLWKLVYIARVVPIKGLLDMIDSVRLMVDRGLNIHLDVCGPTEHTPSYFEQCLTRIVEQDLERFITIRGTVKVRELLPEFDLFVLPSYNEGLPVVSLETMGAGIPTVSTDVGAVRSVVEDMIVTEDGQTWDPCGFIIDPGEPVVMADKVQEVISDVELYERFSLNARGRVEAAYDLVKVNSSYNKIYRQGGAGGQTRPAP